MFVIIIYALCLVSVAGEDAHAEKTLLRHGVLRVDVNSETENPMKRRPPLKIETCNDKEDQIISTAILNKMVRDIADLICTESGASLKQRVFRCEFDGDTNKQAAFAERIGNIVQLAFHDAVTFDNTRRGGADGCIDFDDFANRGLRAAWEKTSNPSSPYSLEGLYEIHSAYTSKADFIALTGNVAIMLAKGPGITNLVDFENNPIECSCIGVACKADGPSELTAAPCVDFKWGRTDAIDCSSDEGKFPDAGKAHNEIRTHFIDRLGFDNQEVVALMGAHTIGSATLEESHYGFYTDEVADGSDDTEGPRLPGQWDCRPDKFDNRYYTNLLSKRFQLQYHNHLNDIAQTPFDPPTFQWHRGGAIVMLNTDLSLIWELERTTDPITPGGRSPVQCGATALGRREDLFEECEENVDFHPHVKTFADEINGEEFWHSQWANAW
eukprot:CAMPEP_0182428334 /NCGR_PEP_ID=MMETSP1167-20130531/22409_1 /TAXON_ID=2988 /ORGANISM="Mallomonas Sp, Strain CCMP3275" /LENGTH=439 /DNA_ID=CAMNT_0024611173 /DNA_START=93 /DNA_END=1409 /DNA_ORIENTATION=+